MRFSSFKYLVKQGWHNMIANKLMSLASIGVLASCLFITGAAVLLSVNVSSFVSYLSQQNEIEFYLSDTTAADAATAFGQQVSGMDNVAECSYISKAQAVEEMKEWMGADSDVLAAYEGDDNPENPLPASIRVTVTDLEQLSTTVSAIQAAGGDMIYKTQSPSDLSSILVSLQTAVNYIGWGLVAILGIVAIVVISNTIRLTVFNRRKEINIMKFVGATNAFIRMPFFVEGITVGTIAGVLATGLVCGCYFGILQYLAQPSAKWLWEFTRNMYPMTDIWAPLLIAFVAFGSFIGGVGTSTSIRKHLKV